VVQVAKRRTASAAKTDSSASAARDARYRAIWAAVAAIPRGSVLSYGRVAALAGLPRGARQVGRALKAAPAARALPWFRVVGAGGRIAFPPGSRNFREQRRRLLAEGLVVVNGRVRLPPARNLDALLWGSGH
jgi:methylated-DNA-protein-cysteine methyltransferase related protein